MIKDENYYVVHGWMRNKLQLKGNDLIVYALLYGFTQDGETEFRGSVEYITDFTGACRDTIRVSLNRLEQKGLIIKTQHNILKGQTNGYICVPLNQLKWVTENQSPPYREISHGVTENQSLGNGKSATINNTYKELYKECKKESKKVGNKEDKQKDNKTYDEIISEYGIKGNLRKVVGKFIQHCALNKHLLLNAELKEVLENLYTYKEEDREQALAKAITKNKFILEPKTELHYDNMGLASCYDGKSFQEIIDTPLFSLQEIVKLRLWDFIRHRQAIGHPMSNESLVLFINKLNETYSPSQTAEKVKAIQTAIRGGYTDIKEEDGWIKKAIQFGGINLEANADYE